MALSGGGSRKRKKARRAGKSAGGVWALRSGGKFARHRPESASAGVRLHSALKKAHAALAKRSCGVADRQLDDAQNILRTMVDGAAKRKARSMLAQADSRFDYVCN